MRKFAITCLILMAVVTLSILASAYYSYSTGKSLEATDDIVNDMASHAAKAKPTDYLPTIPEKMEPIGITLAGIFAGLIVGYLWDEIEELAR